MRVRLRRGGLPLDAARLRSLFSRLHHTRHLSSTHRLDLDFLDLSGMVAGRDESNRERTAARLAEKERRVKEDSTSQPVFTIPFSAALSLTNTMAGSRRRTRNNRTSKARVGVRKVVAAQKRRAPLPVELKFAADAAVGAADPARASLLAGGKLAAPAWNISAPPSRNYAAAGLAVNPNKRTGRNAPTGGLGLEVREEERATKVLSFHPQPSHSFLTRFPFPFRPKPTPSPPAPCSTIPTTMTTTCAPRRAKPGRMG